MTTKPGVHRPYGCYLRRDTRADGVVVSTIDLFSVWNQIAFLPGTSEHEKRREARMASGMATQLGRYETAVGGDYDHLHRARTWQQALEQHERLMEVGWHEMIVAANEERWQEFERRIADLTAEGLFTRVKGGRR